MKIIGIGLNKTGTLSLHRAIKALGFNSIHHRFEGQKIAEIMLANRSAGRKLLHGMEAADCVLDFSPQYVQELRQQYPDCKFILTTRVKEDWIKSRTEHVSRNQKNPDYTGGWLKIKIEAWSRQWDDYHTTVMELFLGDPDFLVLNICAGEGFEKLCPFLGFPLPERGFPHLNKT